MPNQGRADRTHRAITDQSGGGGRPPGDWSRRHARTKPRPTGSAVDATPVDSGSRHGRLPR